MMADLSVSAPAITFDDLPLDIIQDIFHRYIYDLDVTNSEVSVDEARGRLASSNPFTLLPVSKLWRDRVLSLPTLWTTVPIQIKMVSDVPWRKLPTFFPPLDIVSLWLERSKRAPLSLSLRVWQEDDTSPLLDSIYASGVAQLMNDLLIPQAHRWGQIRMDLPRESLELLSTKGPEVYPVLEEINIMTDPFSRTHGVPCLCQIIARAPRLKRFDVSGSLWKLDAIQRLATALPLSNMTHLAFYSGPFTLEFVLKLLETTGRGLEKLQLPLERAATSNDSVRTHPHVLCKNLREIHIMSPQSWELLSNLLDHLTVPHLHSCNFGGAMGPGRDLDRHQAARHLASSFEGLISRSGCRIRRLQIFCWIGQEPGNTAPAPIIRILQAVSGTLEELRCWMLSAADIVNALTVSKVDRRDPLQVFCPLLKRLTVDFREIEVQDAGKLSEMVESRWGSGDTLTHGVAQLQFVQANFSPGFVNMENDFWNPSKPLCIQEDIDRLRALEVAEKGKGYGVPRVLRLTYRPGPACRFRYVG